jgi:hypothetical protein
MKTSPGNPCLSLLVVVLMAFTSCTSTSRTRTAKCEESQARSGSGTAPPAPSDWYLVSNDPPTYFPKGIPADSPTSYKHGEWVYGGQNSERWFLPRKGLDQRKRQELREEALAMQTLRYRNKDTVENSLEWTLEWTARVIGGTTLALLTGGFYP